MKESKVDIWQAITRKALHYIEPMDNNIWEEIKPNISLVRLRKKDTLIQYGEEAYKSGLVLSGCLQFSCRNYEGCERVNQFVPQGCFYGSSGEVSSRFQSSCIALADTDIACFDRDYFERHPYMNVVRYKLLDRMVQIARAHIACMLLNSSEQRYEQFLKDFGEEANSFPKKSVASFLGITTVHLSRLICKRKEKCHGKYNIC